MSKVLELHSYNQYWRSSRTSYCNSRRPARLVRVAFAEQGRILWLASRQKGPLRIISRRSWSSAASGLRSLDLHAQAAEGSVGVRVSSKDAAHQYPQKSNSRVERVEYPLHGVPSAANHGSGACEEAPHRCLC